MKKKVIYLFGAGAAQAVIKAIYPGKGLLTQDIQEVIGKKYSSKKVDPRIWNEVLTKGNDVEHLISMLESAHNYSASTMLRKFYRKAIIEISKDISNKPPSNLYSVLLDLHLNNKTIDEELLCFITLNYEDILERTIKFHFNRNVDYIITPLNDKRGRNIKIFKLHGSFNWLNTRPITIKKMTSIKSENTLWIPPGIDKKKENYPFNLLWGQTMEYLLKCDILRIVGCSLSRNDWGLIPILYTAQKFNEKNSKGMTIEIVDYPNTIKGIKKNYKYLNVIGLMNLPEFISFYKKQFRGAEDSEILKEIENKYLDFEKTNPFEDWLDSKIDYLVDNNGDNLITNKNFVFKFYHKDYE